MFAKSIVFILGAGVSLTREWLTKEEMLARLRMGETFFDKLKKKGGIPHRKYSRKKVLFDPVAVEAALSVFDVEVRS
ncbi:MAG: hypothetical protein LV480_00365 [Methylacidiphilales bacterium]|nr:hypothetical protein [Candidatus Methylacidiphilales bacterium]